MLGRDKVDNFSGESGGLRHVVIIKMLIQIHF